MSDTYKDCSGIKDHASKWAVLNVLIVVCHMNSPLSRLIRLEGSVEGAIILADRTAKRPVGGGVGSHLQQLGSGSMMWVDLEIYCPLQSSVTHYKMSSDPMMIIE